MTEIEALVAELGAAAEAKGVRIATAESCTGGLIAAACTSVSGSSHWFDRGFVTYTESSKEELIEVAPETIASKGVVSEEVARQMALGALRHSHATLAVATTGIAGPTGAEPGKPVGTVCFGFAFRLGEKFCAESATEHFEGDRSAVREAAVLFALKTLLGVVR